jgi:hypothetical protein
MKMDFLPLSRLTECAVTVKAERFYFIISRLAGINFMRMIDKVHLSKVIQLIN